MATTAGSAQSPRSKDPARSALSIKNRVRRVKANLRQSGANVDPPPIVSALQDPLFCSRHLLTASPPRLRRFSIVRMRLLERLGKPGVTAIVAPPGWGKTHLLAQLHAASCIDGAAILFVSARGITTASELSATLHAAAERHPILAAPRGDLDMLSRLSLADDPWTIVLDGIDGPAGADMRSLVQAVGQLASGGNRLILSGRSRRRIIGMATTDHQLVTMTDIAFTESEAHEFLAARLTLDPEQSAQAIALASGWPAGLELAAAEFRRGAPRGPLAAQLCGRTSLTTQYFETALFGELSSSALTLVRHVLDLGSAELDLIQATTDEHLSSSILLELAENTPLFVPALRDDRCFRLSPLAIESASRLFVKNGASGPRHAAAADWLESRGRAEEAIPHALEAGQVEQACRLAEQSLFRLSSSGRIDEALDILRSLPSAEVLARDGLRFAAAWTLATAGNRLVGDGSLQGLGGLTAPCTTLDRQHAKVITALLAAHADNPDWAIKALEPLAVDQDLLPAYAATQYNILRWIARQSGGELEPSLADDVVDPIKLPGLFHSLCARRFRDADILINRGEPQAAVVLVTPLLHLAETTVGHHAPAVAQLSAVLAFAHWRLGEQVQAREVLRGRVHDIEALAPPDAVWMGMSTAARIAETEGRSDDALAKLVSLEHQAAARDLNRIVALSLLERARMANRLARPEIGHGVAVQLFSLMRSSRASGSVARRLIHMVAHLGLAHCSRLSVDIARIAHHLLAAARLAHELRDYEASREIRFLQDAYGLAQAPSQLPLHVAPLSPAARAQIGRDIALATGVEDRLPECLRASTATAKPLAFTTREGQIFSLVEEGLSNKAIARTLQLGDQTVKWHLKKVFAKLGAHDRQHAVERARALGLSKFAYARM